MDEKKFHIVLVEPEIPNNTGNIGRTCVGMNAKLHLIKPLGFELSDKKLKRAGLDYWPHLDMEIHECYDDWWKTVPNKERVFFFSKKVKHSLYDASFKHGDSFVFGKETKGLKEDILKTFDQQTLFIPMDCKIRSYNLANSVAMALSEATRQQLKN